MAPNYFSLPPELDAEAKRIALPLEVRELRFYHTLDEFGRPMIEGEVVVDEDAGYSDELYRNLGKMDSFIIRKMFEMYDCFTVMYIRTPSSVRA